MKAKCFLISIGIIFLFSASALAQGYGKEHYNSSNSHYMAGKEHYIPTPEITPTPTPVVQEIQIVILYQIPVPVFVDGPWRTHENHHHHKDPAGKPFSGTPGSGINPHTGDFHPMMK